MGRRRRFRFGVIGEDVRSGERLADLARRAEELGYSTLLPRDQFVREPFGDQLAPLVALTCRPSAVSSPDSQAREVIHAREADAGRPARGRPPG